MVVHGVSLFSNPSLYWIKTVIKLFSTGCRRVSLRGFRDQSGVGGENNWRSPKPGGRCPHNTHANQLYLHKFGTFVVVPVVLSKFSKIGNVFFFWVYDASISWNYILFSVTYNFGMGKWVKIERNDGILLRVKTLLVDWRVFTWEQWGNKIIRQNRMSFSYIFPWSCQVRLRAPPFFPDVSTSSV